MSKSYILSRMDWAKAYRDYEVLKVGGRNLSINTAERILPAKDSGASSDNFNYSRYISLDGLIMGEEYTFSAYVEKLVGEYKEISLLEYPSGKIVGVKPNHLGFVNFSFIANAVSDSVLVYAGRAGETRGNSVLITKAKLEKGNKITDWTPHPSEINTQPFPAQVAQDMYQAKTGNWGKAEKDYELLKVGKENLFPSILDNRWVKHPNLTIKNEYSFSAASGANMSTRYELDVKAGEEYSVSWKGNGRICISVYDSEKERVFHTCTSAGIGSFTVPNSGILLDLAFSKSSNQINELVSWENVKLEKGKRTTPFTPSPQSIDANDFIVNISNDSSNLDLELSELRNAILQLGGK